MIPVAMLDTDKVQPTGRILPKLHPHASASASARRWTSRRYEGMAGDRFVERAITDEIMYELMALSGQEYVDVYAAKVKEQRDPVATFGASARRASAAEIREVGERIPTERAGEAGRHHRHAGLSACAYFYDCEFIEDGRTIDLVSIGVVDEDGREFYAVSTEFDDTGRCRGCAATCWTSCRRRATRPGESRERIRDDLFAVPASRRGGPSRWSCGPGTPRTTTWCSPNCGGDAGAAPGDPAVHQGSAADVGRRAAARAAGRRPAGTTRWSTRGTTCPVARRMQRRCRPTRRGLSPLGSRCTTRCAGETD